MELTKLHYQNLSISISFILAARRRSLRFVMIEVKRFAINFSVRRLLNFLVFACSAHLAEEQRQSQTKTTNLFVPFWQFLLYAPHNSFISTHGKMSEIPPQILHDNLQNSLRLVTELRAASANLWQTTADGMGVKHGKEDGGREKRFLSELKSLLDGVGSKIG